MKWWYSSINTASYRQQILRVLAVGPRKISFMGQGSKGDIWPNKLAKQVDTASYSYL
jgi:hypothetical protein